MGSYAWNEKPSYLDHSMHEQGYYFPVQDFKQTGKKEKKLNTVNLIVRWMTWYSDYVKDSQSSTESTKV